MSEWTTLKTWIYSSIFNVLVLEAQEKAPLETGGCLMGYWSREYDEVVITHSIGPGPKAIHRKYSFKADFDWQQKRIHKIYQGSERRITYLGDWHTHFGGNEILSRKDLKTLKKISRHKPARTPVPLMGVLHCSDKWILDIWKYERSKHMSAFLRGKIYPMQVEFIEDGVDQKKI